MPLTRYRKALFALLLIAGFRPARCAAAKADGDAGVLGPYSANREASGTSWQPDAVPIEGIHKPCGSAECHADGFVYLTYTDQGKRRGGKKFFSTNEFQMGIAKEMSLGKLGSRGTFSLEPATIGKEGYPLLFQTGETPDGKTPYIDFQSPHDFFSELALTYHYAWSERNAVFLYGGPVGEPALGPPASRHRLAGSFFPESPISHHYIESTHIAFGVGTLGLVLGPIKLDGSLFRGREPDQNRWDIESGKLDSYSVRLSLNPTANWAIQSSLGHLVSPEVLVPGYNVDRVVASVTHTRSNENNQVSQTTLILSRSFNYSGNILDAYLFETARKTPSGHAIFGRVERVETDLLLDRNDPAGNAAFTNYAAGARGAALFPHPGHQPYQPATGAQTAVNLRQVFIIGKVSIGGFISLSRFGWPHFGVGVIGSMHLTPKPLEPVYGEDPTSLSAYFSLRY